MTINTVKKKKKKNEKRKVTNENVFISQHSSGDYMTSFCRDEIATRQIGTDFILLLHGKINFRPARRDTFPRCIYSQKHIDCH